MVIVTWRRSGFRRRITIYGRRSSSLSGSISKLSHVMKQSISSLRCNNLYTTCMCNCLPDSENSLLLFPGFPATVYIRIGIFWLSGPHFTLGHPTCCVSIFTAICITRSLVNVYLCHLKGLTRIFSPLVQSSHRTPCYRPPRSNLIYFLVTVWCNNSLKVCV